MRLIFLVLLFCLLSLTACTKTADAEDSQGNPIRLADYKGKWVAVNYWASWCKPCLTELPELNALHLSNPDKVVVLGVSFDPLSNAEIQTFSQKLAINFPMLKQFPIEKFGIDNIETLPITFVIAPDGKLAKKLYGPQTQASLLKAME